MIAARTSHCVFSCLKNFCVMRHLWRREPCLTWPVPQLGYQYRPGEVGAGQSHQAGEPEKRSRQNGERLDELLNETAGQVGSLAVAKAGRKNGHYHTGSPDHRK